MQISPQSYYSIEELKRHDKEGDMWIALYGNVYDLSKNTRGQFPSYLQDLKGYAGKHVEIVDSTTLHRLERYIQGPLANYKILLTGKTDPSSFVEIETNKGTVDVDTSTHSIKELKTEFRKKMKCTENSVIEFYDGSGIEARDHVKLRSIPLNDLQYTVVSGTCSDLLSASIPAAKIMAVGALAIAAIAGVYEFFHNPSESQARTGIAFQRERLESNLPLGRRDALALLRASRGRVPASTLLGTRMTVMDYLMALRGFARRTGMIENAPMCPDEDVRAKLRRVVRRSSAMTRAEWVHIFPCILEIAITDPDKLGRRRRTDVTCEMLLKEPWLALGRLDRVK